ncbi:MAG: lytic transglycosylase domain-containing protein [Longimicrobiales bacterium]
MTDHPHRRRDDQPAGRRESQPFEPSTEDQPRRRAADQAVDEEVEPKPRRRRKAGDFFQRFREPIIGLGLAGFAVPLIHTIQKAEETPEETDLREEDKKRATEQVAPDLEDEIAGRIAHARADSQRADTVQNAVDRYDIDRDLAEDIYLAAAEAGIEPKLAYGLVKTESAFKHDAISHVGARGLTQLMPRTAAWMRPGTRAQDLHDRRLNLSLGFKYLNQLIDKYNGDVELALLAYNRGPGTVDRILKRGGNPDNGYARKVLKG